MKEHISLPTIKEKVIEIFLNRIAEQFLREEIIDLVVKRYPETERGSVIPSDYCYNRVNKGISFDFHFFEYLGEGQYRCLGLHDPYTGAIYWKPRGAAPEQVGEWQDGRFRLWQNAPERARQRWGVNQWNDPRQQRKQ